MRTALTATPLVALALVVAAPAPADEPKKDDWVPLFNGRTSTGGRRRSPATRPARTSATRSGSRAGC
jgi:hypothetical protein